jgi:tRNA1Val (adenine37-N6)-methyltransferase
MNARRRSTADWWRGTLGAGVRWDTPGRASDAPRRGASEVRSERAPGSIRRVPVADTTEDALFRGALTLLQPAKGYRVNVDALLLAAFATTGRAARLALDLGAGTGAVGLALHHVGAARRVVLVEREPDLVKLCAQNLERTATPGSVERLDIATSDLPATLARRVDLVVTNPPYFPPGRGRPRRDPKSRRARSGSLEPFLRSGARALAGPSARLAVVYPAQALPELLALAEALTLVPKRLRFVHATSDRPARIVLLELRLAKPGGLVVLPPLIEWAAPRRRSPELELVVAGRFGSRRAG